MDDFSPENVVKQVAPMRKLLETRDKLKNLLNKMEGNDKLEGMLEDIIKNTQTRDKLSQDLGVASTEPPPSPPEE
jgi:type VI secretion system protein ImpB